jgi:preprotein translocase subunit SecG
MLAVLLVVHLIACLALIGAVLLQRSEGGALGMGGGGTGGFMSGRGVANVLVRTTMVLGAVFFATSLGLSFVNASNARAPSALERQLEQRQADPFDPLSPGGQAPASPAPAQPAPAAPVDPLAPVTAPPAAPAQGGAAPTAPAGPSEAPVPATPTPAENGGSPQP